MGSFRLDVYGELHQSLEITKPLDQRIAFEADSDTPRALLPLALVNKLMFSTSVLLQVYPLSERLPRLPNDARCQPFGEWTLMEIALTYRE